METFNKPKIAVLKRFCLRLSNGVEIALRNIKVVKDSQRHVVRLEGNPVTVMLMRVKHEEQLNVREGVRLFTPPEVPFKFKARTIVWGRYLTERCTVYAYSNDIGLAGIAVTELPAFIERLLM